MLLSVVQQVLRGHNAELVLVACSGGVDSIVLVEAAIDFLGLDQVIIGHVDHGIRDDSAEDAMWLQTWATSLGLRFVSTRLPPGPSDEASMRSARYAALRKQKSDVGADFILTAHHEDDQAETVIMNLIRGTHWPSLAGIAEARDDVLRPMLRIPKDEILRFARQRNLKWREDWTNREPHYLRNRIRKELLPLMETRYRSGLRGRLANLARDIRTLLQVESDDEGMSEYLARTNQNLKSEENSNKLPISDVIPSKPPTVEIEKVAWSGDCLPTNANEALFDSSVITSIYVRRHRPGDRIHPFGMLGSKKLQDVLVDAKIPRELRPWMLILVDEQDRVLWVPGVVRASLAPVTAETEEVWRCRTTGQ